MRKVIAIMLPTPLRRAATPDSYRRGVCTCITRAPSSTEANSTSIAFPLWFAVMRKYTFDEGVSVHSWLSPPCAGY